MKKILREINSSTDQLSNELDDVVSNKLKEFQEQIDNAITKVLDKLTAEIEKVQELLYDKIDEVDSKINDGEKQLISALNEKTDKMNQYIKDNFVKQINQNYGKIKQKINEEFKQFNDTLTKLSNDTKQTTNSLFININNKYAQSRGKIEQNGYWNSRKEYLEEMNKINASAYDINIDERLYNILDSKHTHIKQELDEIQQRVQIKENKFQNFIDQKSRDLKKCESKMENLQKLFNMQNKQITNMIKYFQTEQSIVEQNYKEFQTKMQNKLNELDEYEEKLQILKFKANTAVDQFNQQQIIQNDNNEYICLKQDLAELIQEVKQKERDLLELEDLFKKHNTKTLDSLTDAQRGILNAIMERQRKIMQNIRNHVAQQINLQQAEIDNLNRKLKVEQLKQKMEKLTNNRMEYNSADEKIKQYKNFIEQAENSCAQSEHNQEQIEIYDMIQHSHALITDAKQRLNSE